MKKAALYTADDKKIEKETEKKFSEWKKILDKWKGYKKGNTKITEHLKKKYKLKEEWARALATRYEKEKFLKKK
jgi:hypothetical protein